jgi:hypothetical protein
MLDFEPLWDEILGKAVTEPLRFLDGAIRPYREIIDDDYLDIWGKTPTSVLKQIQKGRGFLVCATGISFATSQILVQTQQQKPEPHDHKSEDVKNELPQMSNRLFAYGQMWQVVEDDLDKARVTEQVFSRIEQGQRIQKQHLEAASKPLLSVVKALVAEGFLCARTTTSK